MKWHARRDTRKIHKVGAIIIALPFLVILITGLLLQVKKDVAWVQPSSIEGVSKIPIITFQQILEVAKSVPEAEINTWADINRLDVRPDKGMVKIRANNQWEIQIDSETAEILQVEYRRSDIIEAMHDGSWFADAAKYWIFLPTGFIILVLWITGIYMYFIPALNKRRNQKRMEKIKQDSVKEESAL